MLAAAYLAGLQLAIVRARKAGLDSGRMLDLGVYIVIAALVGAKLLLLARQLQLLPEQPRRDSGARPIGRRVLRRPHHGHARRVLVYPAPQAALLDDVRHVRAGHRARPRHRPARLPDGGLLLRTARRSVPWAVTFTDPFAAANVGTPLNVPLHPTQIYEAGAELLILIFLLVTERKGRPYPGPHVLGLHVPVRGLAVHHRVLSRATSAASSWACPRRSSSRSSSRR